MAAVNLLANQYAYPRVLAAQQLTSTAETTILSPGGAPLAAPGTSVSITHGVLCNTTGSAVTVSLSLVPSGGTAGVANRVMAAYSLPAGDSLDLRGYVVGAKLNEGDFLSALAGTANAVTVVLSGVVSS